MIADVSIVTKILILVNVVMKWDSGEFLSKKLIYFFIWASLVFQTVGNLPTMQETQVQSLEAERSPGERNGNALQWTEEPGWVVMRSQRVAPNMCHNILQCSSLLLRTFNKTICCCSVGKSCPALCNLMDCSTPGSSVPHSLLEFAQINVYWVSDAI